jgi:hypothetical protein
MIDKKKEHQKKYSKCKGNLLNELLMLNINWLNGCLVQALLISKWSKMKRVQDMTHSERIRS